MRKLCLFLLFAAAGYAQAGGYTLCDGEYALCAASTCKPTGKTIAVSTQGGGTASFPEVACECPVLKGEALADVKGGNMQGSCTAPAGTVWSLFAPKIFYPQEASKFGTTPKEMKAVVQTCAASLNLGAESANCFSMSCKYTKDKKGVQVATCFCPMGENPLGKAIPAATEFATEAGQGNPAACAQHPVSIPLP